MEKCVFCDVECNHVAQSQKQADMFYNCPNCGRFEIYNEDLEKFKHKKHLIAGYLYEFNKTNKQNLVINIEQLLNDNRMPKTSMQRLERFLLNLYKASDEFGEPFFAGVGYKPDQNNSNISNKIVGIGLGNLTKSLIFPRNYPISIAYARNFKEVKFMFEYLEDLGYLKQKEKEVFIITPKGFERAEQLRSTNIDSKKVFVAMQFKDENGNHRESVIKAIKDACNKFDLEAYTVDEEEDNEGIFDRIISGINTSKFVIVDLTYKNAGAYLEAGYAQGLGREVIRCCKKSYFEDKEKGGVHFDLQHYRIIDWKDEDNLKSRLINRIQAMYPDVYVIDKDSDD